MSLEFRILGPLEVLAEGVPVELGGRRQRAVLAVLLTRPRETVPAARLIDDVWGDDPPQTAANVLQGYVSELRKALGREVIETRGRGYAIALPSGALDLERFERLLAAAEGVEPEAAARELRQACSLWRGPPLADLDQVPFVRLVAGRLEELRLVAVERLVEAELACGRAAELVGELEALVGEHPLRERLHWLLMLALYRCGRQAEAVAAYQAVRRTLVEELGLEPGPALRQLEQAILRQDPSLAPGVAGTQPSVAQRKRSILLAPGSDAAVIPLAAIGVPLARRPPRELILVRLLGEREEPAATSARLADLRDELAAGGLGVRVAAYTSRRPAEDVVAVAREQDVDLVLVDAPPSLLEEGVLGSKLEVVLRHAPSDVAVLMSGRVLPETTTGAVLVPFGGAEHEWAAVEVAAWMARALDTSLSLVGTVADRFRGRRDASRLLARASLVVQASLGIVAEPVLVRRGADGVLSAAAEASLLVVGLSDRWRAEGLDSARLTVARQARVPTLLVRRGLRPGGLAPAESMTRFTWTVEATEG